MPSLSRRMPSLGIAQPPLLIQPCGILPCAQATVLTELRAQTNFGGIILSKHFTEMSL